LYEVGHFKHADAVEIQGKYYKEVPDFNHADIRFGSAEFLESLSPSESTTILHELMKNYSKFSEEYEVTTWLAHGSLIGYFWGRKQLPWDSDIGLDFYLMP
jgi:hypothetical protein